MVHPNLLPVINASLEVSRKIIFQYFRQSFDIIDKDDDSPVTIADQSVETAIREIIQQHFPSHAISGEEHGEKAGDSDYSWFIDPIDGTRSFISGSPLFGTLIGVTFQNQPVWGVIDMPVLNERYIAGINHAANCNAQPVSVSQTKELSQAMLYSTDPDIFNPGQLKQFSKVEKQVKLRRFGGDCYCYALLCRGCIDLVIEADLKYHDILPLIALIESAGGVVTDWQGNTITNGHDGTVVAAATKALHQQSLEVLNSG